MLQLGWRSAAVFTMVEIIVIMWLLVSVLLVGQSACSANGIKELGMAAGRLYREHSRMVDVPPNLVCFACSFQAVLIHL